MKIKITRANGTVVEAEGDAAECEAFMRGATASCSTYVTMPGGFITARDVQRGIVEALDGAGRDGVWKTPPTS